MSTTSESPRSPCPLEVGAQRAGRFWKNRLRRSRPAQAEEIAQRAFDIRASAHPLASERDQNFRLRAEDGSEWVLKIANPAEDPAILDMQTRALLHIAQVDPSWPFRVSGRLPKAPCSTRSTRQRGRRAAFHREGAELPAGAAARRCPAAPGARTRRRGDGRASGPRAARLLASLVSPRPALGPHPGAGPSLANAPHRERRAPPRHRRGSRSLRRERAPAAPAAARAGDPQRRQPH